MNQNREWEQLKEEYHNVKVPENGLDGLNEAIHRAKSEKNRKKKIITFKRIGTYVAAALVIAILLPNINVNIAMAMEKIPVIGSVIRVITFGRYDFEDEHQQAEVEIPKVEAEVVIEEQADKTTESVESLNKDIEDYITPIVEDFKSSLGEEYHKSLDITYEVVTNTDQWFTLRLDVLEIQASGYQYHKYYHINKATGERALLKDIFKTDADYATVLSDNIKNQMREQMSADEGKMYFVDSKDMPESNFEQIKDDQNFYFNEDGEIVIAFDEYEVAPGYMGAVEFTIPHSVTDSLIQ